MQQERPGIPVQRAPCPPQALVWWVGREDFLAEVGGLSWGPEAFEASPWDEPGQTWGWEAGWGGPFQRLRGCAFLGLGAACLREGLLGPLLPPMHTDRHTEIHARYTYTHTLTHSQRHTPYSLLLGAGAFCLAPEGPCHRPEWTPCPTEHDSFRQLMPQAGLVPVLATSAGQVVRRVLGLGGTCPGAPTEPPPSWAPEASLQQQPLSREWQFHASPRRPSSAPAGPGMGQPCRRLPPFSSRTGPDPSNPLHIQVRIGSLLHLLAVDTGLLSEIVLYVYTDLRGCPRRKGLLTLAAPVVLWGVVYTSFRGCSMCVSTNLRGCPGMAKAI